MLEFNIKNQTLTRLDTVMVVADSKNFLKAEFDFSSEWVNVQKTAVFTFNNEPYSALLINNTCLVPWEVIKPDRFTVSVFGGDLITANEITIFVEKSGLKQGQIPQEPTPDIYAQLLDSVAVEREQAQTASEISQAEARTATEQQEASTISAECAKISEDNAKISEQNSKTSEDNAMASENNAKTSEDNSKTSEQNAKTSEDNALISENNAKTSEDSAKLSEETASTKAQTATDQAQRAEDSANFAIDKIGTYSVTPLVGGMTAEIKVQPASTTKALSRYAVFVIDKNGVPHNESGILNISQAWTSTPFTFESDRTFIEFYDERNYNTPGVQPTVVVKLLKIYSNSFFTLGSLKVI